MATITQGFLSYDPNNPFGYIPPANDGGMWSAPSPAPTPDNPFGAVAPWEDGGQWTAPQYAPVPATPAFTPAPTTVANPYPTYGIELPQAPVRNTGGTFSPAPQYQAPTFTPAPVVQPFTPTFQQPTFTPPAPVQGPVNPYNYEQYSAPIGPQNPAMGDPMMYDAPIGPGLAQPQPNYDLDFRTTILPYEAMPEETFAFQFNEQQTPGVDYFGGGAAAELARIPKSPDSVLGELGQIGREFGQQFNTGVIEPIRSGAGLPLAMDALSLFAGQRPGATGKEEATEFGREFMQTGTSFVPPGVSEYIPNPTYFPLRTFTENTLSPLGMATILPFIGGSSTLARGLGRELLEEAGAAYGGRIASEYTDNPLAITAASLGGSVAGSLSPELIRSVPDIAERTARVADDFGIVPEGGVPGGGMVYRQPRPRQLSAEGIGTEARQATEGFGAGLPAPRSVADAGEVALSAVRDNPVSRAVAKVTPGATQLTSDAAEAGARAGDILKLRTAAQMPENYGVQDVLRAARDGKRQVNSLTERIAAEATLEWRKLGPIRKGSDGNFYLRNVAPSPAEQAAGLDGALVARVLERPAEYALSPAQRDAVEKLTAIAKAVGDERELLGDQIRRLDLDPEERFFWRKATQDAKGQQLESRGGPGGQRLRIGKDKSRVYDDVVDAVRDGVKYEDPRRVLPGKVGSGLQNAVNAHTRTLLEPFSETPAMRVPEAMRASHDAQVARLASIRNRLATAERRANINIKASDELDRALDTINDAVPMDAGRGLAQLPGAQRRAADRAARLGQRAANEAADRPTRVMTGGGPVRVNMPATAAARARAAGLGLASEQVQRVVDDFARLIPDDVARIGAMEGALRRTARRLDTLMARGGQYAETARGLRSQLDSLTDEWERFKPRWDRAVEQSKAPAPGRRTIDLKAAIALAGRDFTEADAKRIERFYSQGMLPNNQVGTAVRKVRAINRLIVPVNAIGDASATFNQLGIAAANKPVLFAKNFGIVVRDMVADTPYNRWLSSAENAEAARYVTLLGDNSQDASDFILMNWLSKVPGLRESQKHFTRFTNRMRVDMWKDEIAKLQRQGQVVDEGTKEAVGKALDRVTGISVSRAGDVEGMAQFAPNWLRSQIETVGTAVANGSLEGQLARQYLKNYIAVGATVVTITALMQDRDLREVLNPFVVRDDGRFYLNPNFMRVRVDGQDISVFGAYDSLARLGIVAADAVNGAIREKDAMELFDFIGYAAGTKGSPLVKFVTDMVKGETFSGGDPLDPIEVLKRLVPFTASTAIENATQGQSATDIIKDSGASFFGLKSSPMSLTERLDQAAGNRTFWSLPREERDAILAANPELRSQVERRDAERLAEAQAIVTEQGRPVGFEQLRAIDADTDARFADLAADFEAGQYEGNGAAFRTAVADIWADRRAERARVSEAFGLFQRTGQLPADPIKNAEARFFALVGDPAWRDVATGKIADYEAYDAAIAEFKAGLTPEQRAHVESFDGGRNLPPVIQRYYDDLDVIQASGYYDAEGRLKFLRENPDRAAQIVPLLERYGLSDTTTGMYRLEQDMTGRQAASDARLAKGEITPEQWREDMRTRQAELRGARDYAYADVETTAEANALDSYFATIDSSTLPDGTVNWDAVDRWVAQQPPDVQQAIVSRQRNALSPQVAQYYQDVAAIEASGYWEVSDRIYERWAVASGIEFPGSSGELIAQARQRVIERLAQRGITGEAALAVTQQVLNDLFEVPSEAASKVRKALREDSRDLQTLLIRWGYWSPGKADTAEFVAGTR